MASQENGAYNCDKSGIGYGLCFDLHDLDSIGLRYSSLNQMTNMSQGDMTVAVRTILTIWSEIF